MNEQLEKLLINNHNPKKGELPRLYTLLLDEYNKDLGEFLRILLKYSNNKAINYFFNRAYNTNTALDSNAMVEYLKGHFKSIIEEFDSKKTKVCNNMLSIISYLRGISEQDTLDLTLLVLDAKLFNVELLKRFGESLIVKRDILNYDYSKLSNTDKQKFEKCYREIFEEHTMCQNELESYDIWISKYSRKNKFIVASAFNSATTTTTPPPAFTAQKPTEEFAPTTTSNSPSNANENEVYTRLETLVNTESQHIAKLESLMMSLKAIARLTAELESVKGERDNLKSTVEDLETQLKEVRLTVSMEKSLSEQTMVTFKTDIKNALKQLHEDYTEMKDDGTVDQFCLGTIGNIFKVLSRYGINL